MEAFLFCREVVALDGAPDVTLRIGSSVLTRDQLFDRYVAGLSFPDYFGRNWDALDECLRDLHWIRQSRVVILHDELPRISEKEMRVYISILKGAVEDWCSDEAHELVVVFPDTAEQHMRELMDLGEA